jgi:hypothetical protein
LGAATAVGSSSFNFNGNSFRGFSGLGNHSSTTTPAADHTNVLGIATSKPFTDAIFGIFSHVPIGLYILGGIEFILIICLGLTILIVYKAWSNGMLIKATETALDNKIIHIPDTSRAIFPKILSLVWLDIVPSLIFAAAMARKKIWAMLLLGLVNNVLTTLIWIVPIVIIIVLVLAGVFGGTYLHTAIPALIGLGILVFLPVLFGIMLLSGITTAFKATVWTDAYLKIKDKYK